MLLLHRLCIPHPRVTFHTRTWKFFTFLACTKYLNVLIFLARSLQYYETCCIYAMILRVKHAHIHVLGLRNEKLGTIGTRQKESDL